MVGKTVEIIEEKQRKLAVSLYKIDCLLFGSFTLSSNITVNAFLDLITVFSHPEVMNELCEVAALIVKQKNLSVPNICGVAYAGLPFAIVIANKLEVPLVMRTKELCYSAEDTRVRGNIGEKTEVLMVEEVICSGTSTLQAIKDIEDAGMVVKHVLVMVDLEQGAETNLNKMGYQLHSVFTLSNMAAILYNEGLLNEKRMDDVREGWKDMFAPNGDCISNTILGKRKLLKYDARSAMLKSKVSKRIFSTMIRKQTNLCVELLSSNVDSVLKTADQIGPHICMLNVHVDTFSSFDVNKANELRQIALKHDFLLMDDRKFSDEGTVLRHQLKKALNFVDVVTVIPLAGASSLTEVKAVTEEMPGKGIFLVGSSLTQDSLNKSSLERKIIKLGLTHCPSVVGFISHQNSDIPLGYIHMMPDMKTTATSVANGVSKSYYSEEVMSLKLAADVVMMSFDCDNTEIVDTVKAQQQAAWLGYEDRLCEKDPSM